MGSTDLVIMRLFLLCLLLLLFLECVSSKRKPKPKSKPKGKTKPKPKGEPVRPTIVKKPSLAIFKKYTKKPKGGRCWWDMTRTDCAQCKKGGVQCGYPMHKFCFKNTPGMGCPGVPNHKYTLSTRGYPCYWTIQIWVVLGALREIINAGQGRRMSFIQIPRLEMSV